MKTSLLPTSLLCPRRFRVRFVLVSLALTVAGLAVRSQTPDTPGLMTYQGFLVDGNGVALGNAAPKNYDVIFRIYNHESASASANLLWSEQQTLTVDKGYFSAMLGEGAQVGSEPRPALATVFKGPSASDRYVGITVKGIGSGGANVDILPRLRLMSAPYAFLAQQAVKLVQDTGGDLVSASGNAVTVSGSLTATSFSGSGASLISLNAGNIASGTLADARIPSLNASKITAGTFDTARIPSLDASKITGGTLDAARIPNLDASKITGGTLNAARIPGLPASQIVSGTLSLDRIPSGVVKEETGNGLTFRVAANYVRVFQSDDKNKSAYWWRQGNGMVFRLEGGSSQGGSATKDVVYDGDSNWDFYSDRRLKKDIVDAEPMLERALQVPVRRYRWKEEGSDAKHKLGVVAQEIQPLFPDLVSQHEDRDTQDQLLTVGYGDFALVALKAVQELKARQDAELTALKTRMAELQTQMTVVLRANAELRSRLEPETTTAAAGR